jgi:hypothetical protein
MEKGAQVVASLFPLGSRLTDVMKKLRLEILVFKILVR